MENATKALLIAAAVLLTILVISLALVIINKSQMSSDMDITLNEIEIQAMNSKYKQHEGKCGGTTVKQILSYAISDNKKLFNSTGKYYINIRSNDQDIIKHFKGESAIVTALEGTRDYGVILPENMLRIQKVIQANKKYKVWFSYNKKTGFIWEIHIDTI